MSDLVLLPLGDSGKEYFRHYLGQATGLSAILLDVVSTQSGNVYAAVPRNVSLTRALEFSKGGVMSMSKSLQWLNKHLAITMQKAKGGVVFQDPWAKPDDFGDNSLPFINFIGDDVYHVLSSSEISSKHLEEITREVRSFSLVFALVGAEVYSSMRQGILLKNEIAASTSEIFLRSYDQEGFIIWQKS